VALAATRALLNATTRTEAAAVLHTAVHDLGGAVLPARLAGPNALPVDVSLGAGEPHVVAVDPVSPAASRLAQHLPLLVRDAGMAAERAEQVARETSRAATDPLTGVASRGEIARRLAAVAPGDVVCLLDLDGFKRLNDTRGHAAGDDALRELGALLRASVRDGDFCGRYGGDEFLVVLAATPVASASERMAALAARWAEHGRGTSVSVGVAPVDASGGAVATAAADRAMYRAKRLGGGRAECARRADYDEG
jgi:diguanylate cyclase (GGDEF)-like protein